MYELLFQKIFYTWYKFATKLLQEKITHRDQTFCQMHVNAKTMRVELVDYNIITPQFYQLWKWKIYILACLHIQ